jgi:lipopolysaccharide/colanic/teichoic acid biosynthesis glycosyltransferase
MKAKRALDLVIVVASLPVLIPAVGLLAAVCWLCQGRPVFFLQERVGERARPFWIWKLRTMTLEPNPRDRRPTRLGQWLRERGLDELPQALNILLGQMSCVGPRPLTPVDAQRLMGLYPPFAARFAAKPGLTGLGQVCVARGVEFNARLDAEYARRQGLWLDLAILAGTLWIHVVGKRRGARPLPPGVRSSP